MTARKKKHLSNTHTHTQNGSERKKKGENKSESKRCVERKGRKKIIYQLYLVRWILHKKQLKIPPHLV